MLDIISSLKLTAPYGYSSNTGAIMRYEVSKHSTTLRSMTWTMLPRCFGGNENTIGRHSASIVCPCGGIDPWPNGLRLVQILAFFGINHQPAAAR